MYCSSCGKQMDHIRMRCSACHHMTSAYWLNAYSLALWLLIIAANFFYLVYLLPIWANLMAGLGVRLPLPLRVHAGVAGLVTSYGWLVLLLLILLFGILHWKKVQLPGFLKAGKLLASFTWLVAAGTFATLLAALVLSSIWAPDILSAGRVMQMRHNHLAALDALRELDAAETAYKQKNPALGYTCKLGDLKGFARPIQYMNKGYTELLFTGNRDGYTYSLQGCAGKPDTAFQVTAVPDVREFNGRFAFCSDQSGAVYYAEDGTAKTCLAKHVALY